MRRLIALVESAQPGAYMLHVSPLANLASIKKQGLVPNAQGGNYSGYHSSLPGVYVTNHPSIIRQHIDVRGIEDAFLLAVVLVGQEAFADEDAIDDVLARAYEAAGGSEYEEHGGLDDDPEEAAEKIALGMLPLLRRELGISPALDDGFLIEFCATWIRDWQWGEGGVEMEWWVEAKDRLVRSSRLASATDQTPSLRLPGPVGFDGDSRIVALIAVENGKPEVVHGRLSPEGEKLVGEVIERL